jgi:hypothetical protein
LNLVGIDNFAVAAGSMSVLVVLRVKLVAPVGRARVQEDLTQA